jgi:3-hydroxyisobutyrate dehydrogenase-like beta-hydroxyacid dehydrogenase
MAKKIGVIGLGNIGSSIAMYLVKNGFEVFGFDVRAEANAQLVADGGTALDSVGAVASSSEILISSLPSVAALHSVLDQIEPHMKNKVLIETSTLPLDVKFQAHSRVTAAGGQIMDCPLSGTAMQARKGDVVAYASADAGVLDQVRDVLDGFNRKTYDLGAYGTGSKMKIIANLLVAVHNVATAEALVLAQKAGLDLNQAIEVVSDGAGGSRMLEVRGPMMANNGYGEPGMNVGVFMKDIAIISDFALEVGAPIPLLNSATPIYTSALARGWGGSDTASVYAILADMANIDRTPTPQEDERK